MKHAVKHIHFVVSRPMPTKPCLGVWEIAA